MEKRAEAPDWAAVREEYEGRAFSPTVICRRHGITAAQLRYRRETEEWDTIRGKPPRRRDVVLRLLRVLDMQIGKLEDAVNEPIDKQANILAQQVKTLDKLIELGAAKPNVEPPTRTDMADLRAKLVKRMQQFNAR